VGWQDGRRKGRFVDRSGTQPPGDVVVDVELSGTSLGKEFGLPYDSWWVHPQRVDLVDGRVRWWYSSSPRRPSTKGMLEAFIRLTDAQGVRSFVKRYGPLGLCAGHGMPVCRGCQRSHRGAQDVKVIYERLLNGIPLNEGEFEEESVDGYLLFSRVARAMLTIGAQLRLNRPGADEDWRILWEWGVFEPRLWLLTEGLAAMAVHKWGDRCAAAWPLLPTRIMEVYLRARSQPCCEEAVVLLDGKLLAGFLNTWLLRGQTTPGLDPDWVTGGKTPEPRIRLSATGFGRLGMQLLSTIVGADLAICDGCLQIYERYVSAGRRNANYCPRCRADGTMERLRKREQRAAARRLPREAPQA
jgi:hypothetical protein